jgi:hypothetical protein
VDLVRVREINIILSLNKNVSMQVKDRIQGGQKVKFPLGWMVFSTFDGKPYLPSQFKFYARGINERLWKEFYAPDSIVVIGSIQPQDFYLLHGAQKD